MMQLPDMLWQTKRSGIHESQNYTNNYVNADELKEMMDRENAVYAEQSKALGIAVK
ncbi:MAG: hypothetical protein ACLR0U_28860 [Enterocloster clostridioformis]